MKVLGLLRKNSRIVLTWIIQCIFLVLHLKIAWPFWLNFSKRQFTSFQLERSKMNQNYKEMKQGCHTGRWLTTSEVHWRAALRPSQHIQKCCYCPRPPRGTYIWHPTAALFLKQSPCLLQNLKAVKRHQMTTVLHSSYAVLDLKNRPL